MKKDKSSNIVTTLRLSEEKNKEVKKLANQLEISQNDLIKIFINIGIISFEKFTFLQAQGLIRFLSQNP